MEWTAILQGVRMMKFRDVFGCCEERELSQLEVAGLLGVSKPCHGGRGASLPPSPGATVPR